MLEMNTGQNVAVDRPVAAQAAAAAKPKAVLDREVKPEPSTTKPEPRIFDQQELVDVANVLTDVARTFEKGLRFKVVGDSHRTVVQVIVVETDEVIRSIPSEEALAL